MTDRTEVINGLEREIKRIRKEPKRKMLGVFMTVDEAEGIVTLLKEQEPKTVLYRDDGEYCPWCSTISTRTMGAQRLHHGTRYCPYCGQAVKWE